MCLISKEISINYSIQSIKWYQNNPKISPLLLNDVFQLTRASRKLLHCEKWPESQLGRFCWAESALALSVRPSNIHGRFDRANDDRSMQNLKCKCKYLGLANGVVTYTIAQVKSPRHINYHQGSFPLASNSTQNYLQHTPTPLNCYHTLSHTDGSPTSKLKLTNQLSIHISSSSTQLKH